MRIPSSHYGGTRFLGYEYRGYAEQIRTERLGAGLAHNLALNNEKKRDSNTKGLQVERSIAMVDSVPQAKLTGANDCDMSWTAILSGGNKFH